MRIKAVLIQDRFYLEQNMENSMPRGVNNKSDPDGKQTGKDNTAASLKSRD